MQFTQEICRSNYQLDTQFQAFDSKQDNLKTSVLLVERIYQDKVTVLKNKLCASEDATKQLIETIGEREEEITSVYGKNVPLTWVYCKKRLPPLRER